MQGFQRPRILGHYSIWSEPPDATGDEVLRISSPLRKIKLKGHSFREFQRHVIPLLDGTHPISEIRERTSDIFDAEDLDAALAMLGQQGVLVEGGDVRNDPRAPQTNLFHDLPGGAELLQKRLEQSTVAILGLGGAGATTAMGLASVGVGRIIAIDPGEVTQSDVYLSAAFGLTDIGRPRAEALADALAAKTPQLALAPLTKPLETEDDIRAAIEGATYVVSCLDPGLVNLSYKLNKVCLADKRSWISTQQEGVETVVGPGVVPGHTACFMCYRMRTIATAGNPEAAFAHEKYMDKAQHDVGAQRQSTVFSAGLAANYLGLEVLATLAGYTEPALTGRVLTINLATLETQRHMVLRKPWCPACHGTGDSHGT